METILYLDFDNNPININDIDFSRSTTIEIEYKLSQAEKNCDLLNKTNRLKLKDKYVLMFKHLYEEVKKFQLPSNPKNIDIGNIYKSALNELFYSAKYDTLNYVMIFYLDFEEKHSIKIELTESEKIELTKDIEININHRHKFEVDKVNENLKYRLLGKISIEAVKIKLENVMLTFEFWEIKNWIIMLA